MYNKSWLINKEKVNGAVKLSTCSSLSPSNLFDFNREIQRIENKIAWYYYRNHSNSNEAHGLKEGNFIESAKDLPNNDIKYRFLKKIPLS